MYPSGKLLIPNFQFTISLPIVISEFKQKRKEDTLGDFSSALEQAMQPWIKSEPGKDQTADLKNAVVPEEATGYKETGRQT
jgi:hypothetical protein